MGCDTRRSPAPGKGFHAPARGHSSRCTHVRGARVARGGRRRLAHHQATALLDDEDAAAFAETVHGYPSPLVALPADRATKDAALIKLISKKAKAPADAFTLAAYDALNVAATTLATTGPKADGASLREVFTHAADGYEGVTGTIELDAAGDRTTAPYAFWSICASGASGTANGPPKWVRTGLWEPPADPNAAATLTSDGCPLT